jgi:hypothetical protein
MRKNTYTHVVDTLPELKVKRFNELLANMYTRICIHAYMYSDFGCNIRGRTLDDTYRTYSKTCFRSIIHAYVHMHTHAYTQTSAVTFGEEQLMTVTELKAKHVKELQEIHARVRRAIETKVSEILVVFVFLVYVCTCG